ncbi:DMT family transporter [Candidatus Sumerlaeota bacterium]|nr:DMT family transporter [Candidatus Sumerlaeota bacterium]
MSTAPATLPLHHRRAEGALFIAAAMWATTFPGMKWLFADRGLPLAQTMALRFGIAVLLVVLWWPRSLRVRGHGRAWAGSLWLGFLLAVGFVAQGAGLFWTSASNSAFITSLYVVFVPILQTLWLRRRPHGRTMMGLPLCFAGLLLLTRPWESGFSPGDLWTLLCAFAFSVYIIELQRLSVGIDLGHLLLGQFIAVAALCLVGCLFEESTLSIAPLEWAVIVHLGVLCTFVATLLQSRFQRDTTPTRAALLFMGEPVIAALLAWGMRGEMLGALGLLGAGLILGGILVSEST